MHNMQVWETMQSAFQIRYNLVGNPLFSIDSLGLCWEIGTTVSLRLACSCNILSKFERRPSGVNCFM